MQDNIIENKVKVFISSKCDGRYTLIRKALKTLLLETNMTIVYAFETAKASSQDVISSYKYHLDDSDLCVFLIDNKDGVTDAVLTEHKRARELEKKSIYLFCDEKRKKSTQLQNELKIGLREKYFIVHEFSDFIKDGYIGVIRDIIDIYRNYCKGQFLNKEEYSDKNINSISQMIDTYKLDKNLFKGFDLTKNELVKIVYPFDNEIKDTSELDELIKQFLLLVIGKSTVGSVDFIKLTELLCANHKDFMKELVSLRLNAIVAYYNNNLEKCLSILNSAYDKVKFNTKTPNWLLNDISIDIRNIQYLIDETKSQFMVNNRGQQLLDENCENLYYPLLDRYDAKLHENVLKICFNNKTESPYTSSIGGLNTAFENIASTFIVAIMYGSLTHVNLIRERLIDVLSNICIIYSDHSMYMELLKELLMCQKDKEIEKIIRAFNQTTDMLNDTDIDYLLIGINTIPIMHKQLISKFIMFSHFGYYMSEDKYVDISNELIFEIEQWIKNDNRIFSLSSFIFKALKNNMSRLDNNRMISIILNLFNNNLKKWFDDAFEIIEEIDISTLSTLTTDRLIEFIVSSISNDEIRNKCHHFSRTVIYVRKNVLVKLNFIDDNVKKYMLNFYDTEYSLEVFGVSETNNLQHIERFVQTIHYRNQEQGKNGTYYGYGNDPYQTIRNIIEFNDLNLKSKELEKILNALDETMIAQKQSIGAKIGTIQLLIYLKNRIQINNKVNMTFTKWLEKQDEIISGFEVGFGDKDSFDTLRFNLLMLKVCFNNYETSELLSAFSIIDQQGDYEIIKSLQSIENLLYNIDLNKIDERTITMIAQCVIGLSSHNEKDVRFYSAKILIILCRSTLKQSALLQLSKMMDDNIYEIKVTILARISKVADTNPEIVKYIKQKGCIDNHYLVRKIANCIDLIN